jgi:hypothetical protein
VAALRMAQCTPLIWVMHCLVVAQPQPIKILEAAERITTYSPTLFLTT